MNSTTARETMSMATSNLKMSQTQTSGGDRQKKRAIKVYENIGNLITNQDKLDHRAK